MKAFTYHKAHDLKTLSTGKFLAGGTTLIDLMKLEVEAPAAILDINALPFKKIEALPHGGVKIGALVTNSALAHDPTILKEFPLLSQAILAGASAQLRNKATTGGNLLQRTRCTYFRDTSKACNKRAPGSGCAAIKGINRNLAILGTSASCIATNPSDMNVAMMALEAKIHLQGSGGKSREVAINDFFLLPAQTPHLEHALQPHELITAVSLQGLPPHAKSIYVKLRDRASYEFALASAAVVAVVEGGRFRHIRIALGGVGTKPWRSREAEAVLLDQPATAAQFKKAAEAALKDAKPQTHNGFKVELAKRCLVHSLQQVSV